MQIQKYLRRHVLVAALLFAPLAQAADTALTVTGEVKTPLKLTLADIESFPPRQISARDHDGSTANYQGVQLHEILVRAGVPQGELLRGKALQLCVLVSAADGYKAVFSVTELDPLFTDKVVLLAYHRDGKDLDAQAGPLRLVVPDEKRQGRWVREVTGIEIIRVAGDHAPDMVH